MWYDVDVSRISTATLTIRVEADSREDAKRKPWRRRTIPISPVAWWITISRSTE